MKVLVEFLKDIPDSPFKKGDVREVSRSTAHELGFYKLAKVEKPKKAKRTK